MGLAIDGLPLTSLGRVDGVLGAPAATLAAVDRPFAVVLRFLLKPTLPLAYIAILLYVSKIFSSI
jgi:hypothetical protein